MKKIYETAMNIVIAEHAGDKNVGLQLDTIAAELRTANSKDLYEFHDTIVEALSLLGRRGLTIAENLVRTAESASATTRFALIANDVARKVTADVLV